MAQLVEHHLAKVGVAGSNPVVRSIKPESRPRAAFLQFGLGGNGAQLAAETIP